MEKTKWSKNVTNEQVLTSIGEKRILLIMPRVEKPVVLVIF